ncbi:MAG: YkgJ family cysteine cluster protein [bacterium]
MTNLPQIPFVSVNPCVAHACSACCHDVEMLLTDADLARISAAHPGRDFHFVADDGYLQLRTRDGPPARGSHAAPGALPRPCTFLSEDGACTIHAIRPEGCRLYPAVWDDALRGAELDADYCPHTDGFRLPAATVDAVRRLATKLEAERAARAHGASNTL